MDTTTPNMGLTKPEEGASADTWDTKVNSNFDSLDSHNHASGQGVQVPSAGIGIDADLNFNSFAAASVKAIDFAAIEASAMTYTTALYRNSADNELYWRTAGGDSVQLTNGTALNVALSGGIVGDYGSPGVTAELSYSDSNKIFNFLQATNHRAFLDTADIRLFEATAGIANYVKLKCPGSLASSFDVTMFSTLPASTSVALISAAGALSHTRDPLVDTLETVGDLTVGVDANISGEITAAEVATAQTDIKHADRTQLIAPIGEGTNVSFNGDYAQSTSGGASLDVRVDIPVGKRIKSFGVRAYGNGSDNITAILRRSDGSSTTIDTLTIASPPASWANYSEVLATPHSVVDDNFYYITFTFPAANMRVAGIKVVLDQV